MELYKTTHATDWRRVQWVHDPDYDPFHSESFDNDKDTLEALRIEQQGLDKGELVVLGALVELRCPHCRHWQDQDSLWGIVVDANEDLEAWGTANLNIPEDSLERRAHVSKDCEESPNDDTDPNVTERRQIPLSDRAMDYVESAAQTPPEVKPPNTVASAVASGLQAQPFQKRRLPKKVRSCIESALRRADSQLRTGCSVDPKAQELMRLYLDTWVAGPLKAVLEWDDGNPRAYMDWS